MVKVNNKIKKTNKNIKNNKVSSSSSSISSSSLKKKIKNKNNLKEEVKTVSSVYLKEDSYIVMIHHPININNNKKKNIKINKKKNINQKNISVKKQKATTTKTTKTTTKGTKTTKTKSKGTKSSSSSSLPQTTSSTEIIPTNNDDSTLEVIENNSQTNVQAKKPRLTKKILSAYEEETLGIRPVDRGSSWDGNSDSLGSVNSGILEENVCFECGIETSSEDYNKILLCDVCDGEFHLSCSRVTHVPHHSWTCHLCRGERLWFSALKFDIPGFKVL